MVEHQAAAIEVDGGAGGLLSSGAADIVRLLTAALVVARGQAAADDGAGDLLVYNRYLVETCEDSGAGGAPILFVIFLGTIVMLLVMVVCLQWRLMAS